MRLVMVILLLISLTKLLVFHINFILTPGADHPSLIRLLVVYLYYTNSSMHGQQHSLHGYATKALEVEMSAIPNSLLRCCEWSVLSAVKVMGDRLQEVYRLLKHIQSSDCDDPTQTQAGAALGELETIMRQSLFPSQELKKKITVLDSL